MAWSSRKSQLRTGYRAPSQLVKSICSRWTSEPVCWFCSQRFTSSSDPLPTGVAPSKESAPRTDARGMSTLAPSGRVVVQAAVAPARHAAVTAPRHAPSPLQASPVVQAIPSSHALPALTALSDHERLASTQDHVPQGPSGPGAVGAASATQPLASARASPGRHTSVPVHHSPSSQRASRGVLDATPAAQTSSVHARPSSGTFVSSTTLLHPVTASHASSVHGFASSQLTALPPPHTLAVQV